MYSTYAFGHTAFNEISNRFRNLNPDFKIVMLKISDEIIPNKLWKWQGWYVMSNTSKHVNAYARWGCALLGGLLIGLGVAGLVSTSLLARGNEAWTREMNYMLSIWAGFHPSDDVPTAQIPSEAYYAHANLQTFQTVLLFVGIAVSAVGFYSVYSSLKAVSSLPPTSPQPQIVGTAKTKHSRQISHSQSDS